MPGAVRRVNVRGLNELVRTFKVMPDEVAEEFVWELEEAAGPVRLAAQAKALVSMRNMIHSREWAAMRVGIARRVPAHVWVAPQLRGGGRIRKASARQKEVFTTHMQTRALDPALDENADKVIDRIDDLLDRVATHHGF